MADGDWARNITTTGQIGDGREAAAVEYVLKHARAGDIDDVLATIDRFAYEESMLINVGDEKGALLDAAVRRADPKLALELGTYCGYGALRIARAAPGAEVYSVELAEANAATPARSGRMPVSPIGSPVWSAPSATAGTPWMRWPASMGLPRAHLTSCLSTTTRTLTWWTCRASSTGAGCTPARSWWPTTSRSRARRSTANTCVSSRASCGSTAEHKAHVEYQSLISDLVLESEYLGG